MLEPFSTHFCESPGRRKSSVDSTMAVVWETRDGRFCVVVVAEKLARAQSPRPWPWWRHRQSKQSHTAQIRWSTLTWTNSGSQPGHLRTTAPNLGGSSLLLISLHLTSWNILGLECYSIMHNAFLWRSSTNAEENCQTGKCGHSDAFAEIMTVMMNIWFYISWCYVLVFHVAQKNIYFLKMLKQDVV